MRTSITPLGTPHNVHTSLPSGEYTFANHPMLSEPYVHAYVHLTSGVCVLSVYVGRHISTLDIHTSLPSGGYTFDNPSLVVGVCVLSVYMVPSIY
jgi:hypothetical protein